MNELTYLEAVVLGLVQGLAEFLPISSSGHLALTQAWFDLDPDSPPLLLFNVLAHCGTLVAVLVVFAGSFWRYLRRLLRESSPGWTRRRYAWRIALLGVAASIPTAVVGLAFKDTFEAAFAKPVWIAVCLVITGVLLAATAKLPRGRRGWGRFGWGQALLVGLAQALAILPGISRSGATICTAAYCGLRRRWAGEFSFFIAAPAILGATALKVKDTLDLPSEAMAQLPLGPIALGSLISLISGIFALKWLLRTVRRGKLHYFTLYVWLVALIVLLQAGR